VLDRENVDAITEVLKSADAQKTLTNEGAAPLADVYDFGGGAAWNWIPHCF
jgi:hypothetical protein